MSAPGSAATSFWPTDGDDVADAVALVDESAGGTAQVAVVVRLEAGEAEVVPPQEAQQGGGHVPLRVDATTGAHESDAGELQLFDGDAGLVVQATGYHNLAADGPI